MSASRAGRASARIIRPHRRPAWHEVMTSVAGLVRLQDCSFNGSVAVETTVPIRMYSSRDRQLNLAQRAASPCSVSGGIGAARSLARERVSVISLVKGDTRAEQAADLPAGWRRAMIGAMGTAMGSDAVPGRSARSGAGGVVPRLGLFRLLETSARITVVSAPAGSGKTVLLRSWIIEAAPADSAAWVSVERNERDPQRFWLSVLGALRQTAPGSALVGELTAAPDLDGWAIVERLLKDLAPLADRVWLVVDDMHELGPAEAVRQLELLVMRAPPELRIVLATRHDVRLGLHRLRLEGEVTEFRAAELRFTADEARELFRGAGVELPESALALLYERTEGWAAGLRLAALSLAGHPDPGRFAEEFSGSERTVADYLLAEVLERQSEQVRRLLLRTSVLERVNGQLADLLTGGNGGERVLQELEKVNAFVVSLDAARSWFRYHQLFAGLLRLELRSTEPDAVTALHRAAAGWLAGHGFPVEAVRHAQAAQDWGLAACLLASHWPSLQLGGQAANVHALLAAFPAGAPATDAELATVAAADQLAWGSLETAERYITLAERRLASAPAGQQAQAHLLLGVVRLLLARQRGNLPAVAEQAQRLQDLAEAPETVQSGLGEELHALALINLGIAEFWTGRLEEAERHLEQGVALAHRIERPFLEFTGLANQAVTGQFQRSLPYAAERGRQAVDLAERHGWADEPAAAIAYAILADTLTSQGQMEEAEDWLQRAERTVKAEAEPAPRWWVHHLRGILELARGRNVEAVTAFRSAEALAGRLAAPHMLIPRTRALLLHALVRLGDIEYAEQALADLGDQGRDHGLMRVAMAALRLAQHDSLAAAAALAPVLDGSAPVGHPVWLAEAFMLEAITRDALGNPGGAEHALERALDLAERDGALLVFVLFPAPDLLRRHARHGTAHGALLADILDLLAGQMPTRPAGPQPPFDPLSGSEIRVLRYLPTNLSLSEIADQLCVSLNTVRTHVRRVHTKLGTHRRSDTVARARALGLLAPLPVPRSAPGFLTPPDVR
jgi:LuxR family transcriptional regulator, maltose regulon positive regulatory protein